MTTISVTTNYTISIDTLIDLPADKTWEDVLDWHVKWGKLFCRFKDGTEFEHEGETDFSFDQVDFKRPNEVAIRACDENKNVDYDNVLAETY